MVIRHELGHNVNGLNHVRTDLELFKTDHGHYPVNLGELIANKYVNDVNTLLSGEIQTPLCYRDGWFHWSEHPVVKDIRNVTSVSLTDSGEWQYVNNTASPDFGKIFINCTHEDVRGKHWYEE